MERRGVGHTSIEGEARGKGRGMSGVSTGVEERGPGTGRRGMGNASAEGGVGERKGCKGCGYGHGRRVFFFSKLEHVLIVK